MVHVFSLFGWVVTDLSSGCNAFIFHNPTVCWSWRHHDRYQISGTANHPSAQRRIQEVCTLKKTAVKTEHCRTPTSVLSSSDVDPSTPNSLCMFMLCVPVPTEPVISLLILTPMKILQRNLNRSTFVVWEMNRNVSVVCVCNVPNCCDTEQRSASQPGSVASGTPCILSYGIDKDQFTICRTEDKLLIFTLKYGGCCKNEIFDHMWQTSVLLAVNYYKVRIYLLQMAARNIENCWYFKNYGAELHLDCDITN
jgi:hypothetical protein